MASFFAALLVIGGTFAAAADDRETCAKASGDAAIAACTRVITSGTIKGNDLAGVYYNRGIEWQAKRDYDRALADYDQAIRLNPKYYGAFNNRGNVYTNKNEPDRALADFDQAIRLNPKDANVYNNRGLVYYRKRDYDRAIKDFNEAIRLNPKYAAAFSNRGDTYSSKEERDRAIADYNEAIRLDPKNAITFNNRGDEYSLKKDYERAILDFDEALRLNPKYGLAMRNRMNALVELKRFSPAAVDLLTLAKEHPADVQQVQQRRIYSIINYLREQNRNSDALAVLLWLKKADYHGPEPIQLGDGLNPLLIGQYVRLNRADEASSYIAELGNYRNLLQLRADRQYESLWSKANLQPVLQLQDFPARELAAAQKLLAKYPKKLEAVLRLMSSLRLNGRYAEAAKLGQDALNNLSAYDKNLEYEAWIRNRIANVLVAQGRFDDAKTAIQPLLNMNPKEHSFLVNQFINLGVMLRDQGRFQEAMDTAQKAHGFSSPYGEKFVQMVSVCGMSRTGLVAEAETLLADMLKTADVNQDANLDALLCLKHEDQVAALMIKALQTEGERWSMLSDLQDCRENPNRPAFARELRAAKIKTRDRPDVRKALDTVGVIVAEPIACGDR